MKIFFSTAHGNFIIQKWSISQNLRGLCIQNQIPIQSVSFYGRQEDKLSLIVGIHKPISELASSFQEVLIKVDRNIDYKKVVQKLTRIRPNKDAVTEYTFPSDDSEEFHHFELSQIECQQYVIQKVTDFLQNEITLHPTKKIVVGISGGGDSNTLMKSFLESGLIRKDQFIGVMMLGIPDWDRGKSRAEAICNEHGVEIRFVDASTVNQLLGRSKNRDWVEDFEQTFPDADLEVLGTHCIRLALKYIAKETSAQAIVTGLNLEDILAESFFSVMKGKLPPPFPVRPVDGVDFWHPLYAIPKKILDGCYPRYSLQNYNDRYPSRMIGRAIPYYLSQSIHSILPGSEFDLLLGFKKLSKLNQSYGVFDEKLGFSVLETLPEKIRSKWEQFITLS